MRIHLNARYQAPLHSAHMVTVGILVLTVLFMVPAQAIGVDAKTTALVKEADDCRQQGQIDRAIDLYGTAFSNCANLEQTKCEAADILRSKARCYLQQNNLQQAANALRHAVFIYELNERPNIDANRKAKLPHYYKEDFYAPQCAAVLTEYAAVLTKLNKNDEAATATGLAEKLNRKSGDPSETVAEWKKKLGEAIPETTASYSTTAWSDKAEEKFKQLVELGKKFEPASARLVTTYWGFSNWYVTRAKFKEAEQPCSSALAVAEGALGISNPAICDLLCHYANICRRAKNYPKAEDLYKRALSIYSQQLPDTDSNVIAVLTAMQSILKDQGTAQSAKALELKERLSPDAIHTTASVGQTPKAADQNRDLLTLYMANGKYDQAESSLKKVMEFDQTNNEKIALTDLIALADVKCKLKKYAEAEQLYKAARDRCIQERLRQYDVVLEKYAELLRLCDRMEEADNMDAEARQFRLDGKKKLYH